MDNVKKPTKILVIDDETAIRESFTDYLEDRDYTVVTAENGLVGLELLAREQPDAVLVDLRMPEVDGLEVLKRSKEIAPNTPKVVISGANRIDDVVHALRYGAWDYLVKPVKDLSILGHTVEKVLEKARLIRENRRYQESLEELVSERTAALEQANLHLRSINERMREVVKSTRKLTASTETKTFTTTLLTEFVRNLRAAGAGLYLCRNNPPVLADSVGSFEFLKSFPPDAPASTLFRRIISSKTAELVGRNDSGKSMSLAELGVRDYGTLGMYPLVDDTDTVIAVVAVFTAAGEHLNEQDLEIGSILASYGSETLRATHFFESLQNSEKRFRELVEMLPEVIFETDSELNITYLNQQSADLLAYSHADIERGLNAFSLVAPEQHEFLKSNLTRAAAGEVLGSNEYRLLRKTGGSVPVLLHQSPIIRDSRVIGYRGVVIDISERKKQEDELRRNEEHLRTTLNSIGDAVIATSKTGAITHMNPVAEKLTGWPLHEARGCQLKQVFVLVDDKGEPNPGNPVAKILAPDARPAPKERTILRSRDGNEYFIADSGAPIYTDTGMVSGVVLVFRDLSEELALQNRLHQAEKMNAIGQLAGGIAHDFNNMLCGIIGAAELILYHKKHLLDDESVHFVDTILQASRRAADLTTKLLAFGRKGNTFAVLISVHSIIDDALAILKRTIDQKISISIAKQARQHTIIGDHSELQNAFMNVAINAAQAMPEGGIITFGTDNLVLDESYCEQSTFDIIPGEYIEITVSDTGCGITPEVLPRIFEPFYTTKSEGKGTGLGLAAVYGTVQVHHGAVTVESEAGTGTTFRILLPCTNKDVTQADAKALEMNKSA